jgi:hypothetical protein
MSLRTGTFLLRCALAVLLIGVMAPFGVTAARRGDGLHAALAAVEIAGALLLLIPRTVLAGGATLLACVAFALAIQHGTHGSAVPLLYLALLLVALMLLDRALRSPLNSTR